MSNEVRWLRPLIVATAVLIAAIAGLVVWRPWAGESENGLIARVRAATIGLQYYKVDVIHEVSQGDMARTIKYEVEFAAPDRYIIEATDGSVTGHSIVIGKQRYESGQQPDPPAFKMAGITGATMSYIGPPTREDSLDLISSIDNLEKLPEEVIDGVPCLHYRGQVIETPSSAPTVTGTPDPLQQYMQEQFDRMNEWHKTWKVGVEFWIGRDDYLLRLEKRTTYAPPFMPQDEPYTMMSRTRYYEFGIPVAIEPPAEERQAQLGGTPQE